MGQAVWHGPERKPGDEYPFQRHEACVQRAGVAENNHERHDELAADDGVDVTRVVPHPHDMHEQADLKPRQYNYS